MKTAYFSCGAGDFIAIESFLTYAQKKEIGKFILFTRAAKWIEELIRLHPIWKDCEVMIPLTPEEIRAYDTYSFFSIPKLKKKTRQDWPILDGALDCSGDALYPDILTGKTKFTESLFEVEALPITIACDPHSDADERSTRAGRNFTLDERNIAEDLADYGSDFINLGIGSTSLREALGYVRGCAVFYGVDSMLSVWAARQTGIGKIVVKSINPIYKRWQPIYDPFKQIEVVEKIT